MIEGIEKIKKLARGINTKEILQEKQGTCLFPQITIACEDSSWGRRWTPTELWGLLPVLRFCTRARKGETKSRTLAGRASRHGVGRATGRDRLLGRGFLVEVCGSSLAVSDWGARNKEGEGRRCLLFAKRRRNRGGVISV
jgi:hypothetical protein